MKCGDVLRYNGFDRLSTSFDDGAGRIICNIIPDIYFFIDILIFYTLSEISERYFTILISYSEISETGFSNEIIFSETYKEYFIIEINTSEVSERCFTVEINYSEISE